MHVIPSPGGRRPVCASEVYFIADTLRKTRNPEFALPQNIAKSEVRVLVYLRQHGQFIKNHSSPAAAAKVLANVLESVRDLCSVPVSPPIGPVAAAAAASAAHHKKAKDNKSEQQQQHPESRCVLSEEELIQLVDLNVATEVDLYKVVPDIDVRLGGEAKIRPLLVLLQQLKE